MSFVVCPVACCHSACRLNFYNCVILCFGDEADIWELSNVELAVSFLPQVLKGQLSKLDA